MKNLLHKKYTYIWSGHTLQGKKMSGEIEALSFNLAKFNLKQQGITALTLRKKPNKFFGRSEKKISTLDIAIFFRQLATLIAAGVPIVQSCEIMRQSHEKMQFKNLIDALKKEIEAGKNLVSGLRKFPRYFDDLICHLIHAGEQAGTLEIMLKRIAHYKEKSLRLKNQITQALFYPMMIFLVATIVSITMLTFVVPRFSDLFSSMHGKLPFFTLFIISLSNFIRHNIWLGILPVFAIALFSYFFKTSLQVKQHFDHLILHIPFLGNVCKKVILARFARSLATTFAAGIPITEALKMIANASGNHDYTKAIFNLQKEVSVGLQLHSAMQLNPLFPPMPIQMIKIGEESGSLEHMLEKIAEIYEADIDHLVANLSHLLEPLIMTILGVLIGGLVIAMYLPIFKLGTLL